jgi:RNase P/RNase MRP subunit p29
MSHYHCYVSVVLDYSESVATCLPLTLAYRKIKIPKSNRKIKISKSNRKIKIPKSNRKIKIPKSNRKIKIPKSNRKIKIEMKLITESRTTLVTEYFLFSLCFYDLSIRFWYFYFSIRFWYFYFSIGQTRH